MANSIAHKSRMAKRRDAQLTRTSGFTPMRNARVDGAIQAETLRLQLTGTPAIDAAHEARRNIAKMLPAAKPSKLYRYRPSKTDNPAYRKAAPAA